MTVLAILGVLVVLFLAAALATRDTEALAPAPPDRADVALPDGPLRPDDVRGVRFGLALRGYRMREVDAVLDRLAAELADRDARLAGHVPTTSSTTTAGPQDDATDGERPTAHDGALRVTGAVPVVDGLPGSSGPASADQPLPTAARAESPPRP